MRRVTSILRFSASPREFLLRTALTLLLALGAACAESSAPSAKSMKAPAASTNRQVYAVKGVLKSIEKNGRSAKIAHEEIPGYMQAMTMPFDVRNTNELNGLKAGDKLSFDMVVTPDDGWIENVMRIDATNEVMVARQREKVRRVRDVDPLEVGAVMPNYSFTNQFGNVVSLDSFRGNAYGLTFIFTRCPFPNFCPRMSANFAGAAAKLSEAGATSTNWHLISLTIDPDFDTPEVLKAYAARYPVPSERWSFLTGTMMDIDAITEQFGLYGAVQEGQLNHNLRTVVVGADGNIRKIFVGNEWSADEMAAEMISAMKPSS